MPENSTNAIRNTNAAIRYYFKMDPEKLDEDEWARVATELEYILQQVNGKKP